MTQRPSRKDFRARLDHMVFDIRERIYRGEFELGNYLPSEKAFARQYQLSNKSVRQGLEILEQEHLIEKIPRVGNKVINNQSEGIVTLRFGYYQSLLNEVALEQLLEAFHAAYPHIRIKAEAVRSSDNKQFRDQAADQDIITMNYSHYHDYVLMGETNLWESLDESEEHYSFLNEALKHGGMLKMKPFVFSPIILCYNKEHFQEKQLQEPDHTWNWDLLSEYASSLAEDYKRMGFYFHFPSVNRWPVFLLQSGFVYDRTRPDCITISQSQLLRSLNACRNLISLQSQYPLFLSEKDGDAEELFFQGKISMIMTTYFSLNHHRHQSDMTYEFAPLPYMDLPRTLLLIIGLAMNKRCQNKKSAEIFINFMTSYAAQLIIRQNTLSIPASKPAAEWEGEDCIERPSSYSIYRELISTFHVFSDLRMSMDELAIFLREAKLYWSGLETDQGVIHRLEQSLQGDVDIRIGDG